MKQEVEVPVIDLSCFASNVDDNKSDDEDVMKERVKVALEVYEACSTVGFFYIIGHGCPDSVRVNAFEAVNQLFDMSLEEKEEMNAPKSSLYRGYNSLLTGAHSCTPEDNIHKLPDLKESFTLGAEDPGPGKLSSPMHGPNVFPKTLPEFEPCIMKYWNVLSDTVASRLIKALALSLKLEESFFLTKCDNAVAQMILVRYPGLTDGTEDKRQGCGTHTDCGFLTILAQDNVAGLEVQRTDGTWMTAPPIEGAFVVNLGDMAARWTNDVYQSTPHRVFSSSQTRHSIPFFLNCNFDTKVECLIPGVEPKYEATEAGRYILEKLGLMHMMPADSVSV